ncbi:hypothetical protein IQ225_19150, partial [Synechocystis salina LEGE 06155]|nr:hypothetical protein [Synechocystis salina LEGE 06155]
MPVDHTSLTTVYEKLSLFAGLDNFWQNFDLIYGDDYDAVIAEALRSSWARGDFSDLPVIEVVSAEILGAARGGYGASNNTIYLSESLLSSGSSEWIVAVLLEEIGHYVDALVNAVDTPGDEGELFALIVLGIPIDATQLERIKGDDDSGTITVNGETVAIEMATGTPINTPQTTINNNLEFQGTGTGTGADNNGVLITTTGSISSNGTGTITVIGRGSPDGTLENNTGVRVDGEITSLDGAISITGTGGSGTNTNRGVNVFSGGKISSTGIATITLLGQGSTTAKNVGNIGVGVGGEITSLDGAISITGTGGSGTNGNSGIALFTSAKISSTGTGTITLLGQGSTTAVGIQTYGVWVNGAITSSEGAISVMGTGGSGSTAGSGTELSTSLFGVLVQNGGSVSSIGIGANAATITVNGQGSTSTTAKDGSANAGVGVIGASSKIISIDGAISITGTGGSGTRQNIGSAVFSGGSVSSIGKGENAATITIIGQGSTNASGSDNSGVKINGNGSTITSVEGAISIKGTGGSGTDLNEGVTLTNSGQIISTGTGDNAATITIIGQGSTNTSGSDNHGARVTSNSKITSV